jgi:uncharacterized protein
MGCLVAQCPFASTFELGLVSYEQGDFETARKIWSKAAARNVAAAQHNLAVMYDHGQGVAEDNQLAVQWYSRAAGNGHAPSQYTLGLLYSRGQGVDKDMVVATDWYKRAALQGHRKSQFILGVLYDFGKGVPREKLEAAKWYRLAALQGDARAQYNLALMYDFGQGGLDDSKRAVEWYRHAAEQGNAKAQYMLGVAYLQGDGVGVDNTRSFAWMSLAAENGHVRARQYRSHPWQKMSKQEQTRGRLLKRELARKVRLRRSISMESPERVALPTVELIRNTQRVLTQRGLLDGKVDGVLGPQTRAAIKALQQSMRVPQTGKPSNELLLLADKD